ncbi:MAG TPA: molybdopterin-dependent oxidoreductase [Polyangiaceae bacterium]|nr:molybdopterin-dependent oxidoreductase [Polyangiaceae bacterium]
MQDKDDKPPSEHLERMMQRRRFVQLAGAGTVIVAFGGGLYVVAEPSGEALAKGRDDGRPRVPPGQKVITALKPMGGQPGDPNPKNYRLKVHGEVERPFEVDYAELLKLPKVSQRSDVHCVTGWTVLDAAFEGVRVQHLAERAGLKRSARHVIFEAAHGYTANVPIAEALRPNVLVAYRLDRRPLPRTHGGPVRALVPDLYFWKSAKWLTGIRFVQRDAPGYWETRGYHNHADPWREERHA